jgi:fatty-acyl-CoA synthase
MTIGDLPRANAGRTPEGLAYLDGDRVLTWRQVNSRTDRLAHALRTDLGLGSGDVAAILADGCVEHPELMFASSKAGTVHTGLNTRHHPREMIAQVADAGASALFVGPGYEDVAAEVAGATGARLVGVNGAKIADGYEDLLAAARTEPVERHDDDDAVYNLTYTSGTTGEPKGAMISSRNMLAYARSLGWVARSRASDRHLVNLPMFHAGGHFGLMHPAHYGLPVVIQPRPDPADLVRAVEEHAITTFLIVPIAIQMLLDHLDVHPSDSIRSLRLVIYGSNPIPEPVLRRFATVIGCDLAQIGGMGTEGGVGLSLSPEHHAEALADPACAHRLRSCGMVQPGTELRLVDDLDRDVPVGQPGEMLFRGEAFVAGYWKRPDATRQAWRGGWFHSGDIGVMDADGFVTYVDRKAGRIKTGSETVFAREVENAIRGLAGVADVSVVGVPDERWGEAVWAVVERVPGADVDADEVQARVRSRLAGFKVPKRVLTVDALPRTAIGKVAIGQVKALCQETVDG